MTTTSTEKLALYRENVKKGADKHTPCISCEYYYARPTGKVDLCLYFGNHTVNFVREELMEFGPCTEFKEKVIPPIPKPPPTFWQLVFRFFFTIIYRIR